MKIPEKRKTEDTEQIKDLKKVTQTDWIKVELKSSLYILVQAKLETKALKAKRPGFTDERYQETSYYIENGKNISQQSLLRSDL